jgi:hypothetical protein
MQIFNNNDQGATLAAMQTQLQKYGKRARLVFLGTQPGKRLRRGVAPEQMEEIRCGCRSIHADLMETAMHLRGNDRGTIDRGDATGVPQES